MNKENLHIKLILTVFHVLGMLLLIESVFMLLCALPSLFNHQYWAVEIMAISAAITLIFALLLFLPQRKKSIIIDKRQGFFIVTLIWVIFSVFGAIPLYISGYVSSYIDALFETVSGFTTTGSSIMADVEHLPYAIGLWRTTTEWIGGVGIIVIMLSIIPFVGGGGMALFSAEVAGVSKNKIAPHIKKTANVLIVVYVSLTLLYGVTYFLMGMDLYNATCYAFTTVATAGLASKNTSAMLFSPEIQSAMTVFMFISGTNILLIYSLFKGKVGEIIHNEELKAYISIIIIATILIFLFTYDTNSNVVSNIRNSAFMVCSTLTSTGLGNCNYDSWPTVAIITLTMLMVSGAMSGSTSGGLKIIRMMTLIKNAGNTISKGLHSNAFIPVKVNNRMISNDSMMKIFHTFILYVFSLVGGFLILVACGIDIEEALVSAISSLSNVGPGYGKSAYGNFAHFSDIAKMTMCFMMIAGRLELVTVFSIFSRSFWKRY